MRHLKSYETLKDKLKSFDSSLSEFRDNVNLFFIELKNDLKRKHPDIFFKVSTDKYSTVIYEINNTAFDMRNHILKCEYPSLMHGIRPILTITSKDKLFFGCQPYQTPDIVEYMYLKMNDHVSNSNVDHLEIDTFRQVIFERSEIKKLANIKFHLDEIDTYIDANKYNL